ncbi:MAG: polysaccharide biosynthesis C-terminal domain-containing protein [Planctomycetaceae bacterium]
MTVRRNILASWLSHAITLVVGLFLVRYVKDNLGDRGYGAWIFVSSIAGYSGLLYMGFGAAVCRFSSIHYTKQDWPALNRTLSSIAAVYGINSFIALTGAAIAAAAAPWISNWDGQSITEVRQVFLLLGLNAALGLWGSVFSGLLIGIQRFDIHRAAVIAATLTRVVIVVVGLHYAPRLLVMAGAFLAITVLENTIYYVAAHRLVPSLHIARKHVSWDAFRECGGFTIFNAVRMVSEYLIYLTDTVVIGCVLGPAATVPYYIALRLCQMVQSPLENIAEVILPKTGELEASGRRDQLRRLVLLGSGVSLLLVAGFGIGVWYFGERLLLTWLGPGNQSSAPILMILVLASMILMPLRVPKYALMGIGKIRFPATIDAAQAVANLVLSLILVRYWGVIGVAWGTLIPVAFCELGVLLPYCCRTLGIRPAEILRLTILPQVMPLLALWGFCEGVTRLDLPNNWLSLIGIAAGGGGVAIGLAWLQHRYLTNRDRSRDDVELEPASVPISTATVPSGPQPLPFTADCAEECDDEPVCDSKTLVTT